MASSDTPKVTLLRGDPIYGEGTAGGAITPGMLVAVSGGARTVSSAATVVAASAGAVAPVFAREEEYTGGDIDTAYASGDNVPFMHLRRGDWVYAWLAAGEDVAAGASLSAGAAGALVAADAGTPGSAFPTPIIAKALEAVDNDPGTGGAAVRIKVEIV